MSLSLHSQSVNISRTRLLTTLKANLKKHEREYAAAVANYRLSIQADLEEALVKAKDAKFDLRALSVKFAHPTSYASQYQEVIDMLEVSEDKIINVDSGAFQAWYKDNWSWKGGFDLMNSTYSSKAMSVSGRTGNVSVSSVLGGALADAARGAAVRVGGPARKRAR